MSIGKNIKRLRESRDMTQDELGRALGVSSMAVSQWECDRTYPRMGAINAMTDFFHVSFGELAGDEKPTTKTSPVPLLGKVHAGQPTEPDEAEGTVLVPDWLLERDPQCYALIADGDCMDKVYPDGCTIIVSPNTTPVNGRVAVVSIDGREAVMRRIYRTASTLVLSPESHNPTHRDIVITDEATTVEYLGTVVWMQGRAYEKRERLHPRGA